MALLDTVSRILAKHYPNPETELIYHTPFQLLLSVMLSAQTTDKQVNKVTQGFFDTIKTPQDLINRGEAAMTRAIASVNYAPTKARHLWSTAQMLIDPVFIDESHLSHKDALDLRKTEQYSIPDRIERLTLLPGVGIKTAKVVGAILYNLQVVAVDTHVHRVANRLGLCNTTQPNQTSNALEILLAKKISSMKKNTTNHYHDFHHRIILFGRYQCKAQNPQCQSCPLQRQCQYFSLQRSSDESKKHLAFKKKKPIIRV